MYLLQGSWTPRPDIVYTELPVTLAHSLLFVYVLFVLLQALPLQPRL